MDNFVFPAIQPMKHRKRAQRALLATCIANTLQLVLVSLALQLSFSFAAQAHELRPSIANISASAESIQIRLNVNLEALISGIGPEHDDSEESSQAPRYNALRSLSPTLLDDELRAFVPILLDRIVVRDVSQTPPAESAIELPLTLAQVSISPVGDIRVPRDTLLTLIATRQSDTRAITWQWHKRFGPIIIRADSVDTDTGQPRELFSQYLQSGDTSEHIVLSGERVEVTGSSLIDYVIIGFEHIIPKGLDHILFVIGLFLLSPRLRPIVWQVSMFTLAHTLTLALGITGIVSLPANIVEPLIALSITIICIENCLGRNVGSGRLVVIFSFGLLHGLGFAGVLSDIGLQPERFFGSLIAFNIGVELGQLAVVFMCYALVGWWFGQKPWYRKLIAVPASISIGAIGLVWFIQRVV